MGTAPGIAKWKDQFLDQKCGYKKNLSVAKSVNWKEGYNNKVIVAYDWYEESSWHLNNFLHITFYIPKFIEIF